MLSKRMALQYKGYLNSMTLYQYATDMPKSPNNNAQEGFTHDIFTRIPNDVPHWIAPEPLARFGRTSSGNQNVVNITGASLDDLDREEDYVFLNRRGAHLTRNMILIMIKQTAQDAGIKKTISPHTLRHSFATALLKGGADLRVIQDLLGHEDIGTTEVYTHIETSDLREAILNHHPRNIKK